MQLFYTIVSATNQGSGLLWSDVENCTKNAILEVELNNFIEE